MPLKVSLMKGKGYRFFLVILFKPVTGRVTCEQMMPKDKRRSIGEGKKEREGRV